MSNQTFTCLFPLLPGLYDCQCPNRYFTAEAFDSKDKTSGVRNRKHHLSTRQGTCVWRTETAPVHLCHVWLCKWLPLKAGPRPQFSRRQISVWSQAQTQPPLKGEWPEWPKNVHMSFIKLIVLMVTDKVSLQLS